MRVSKIVSGEAAENHQLARLLKQVVNEAAGEKTPETRRFSPTPSSRNSSFHGWGTLRAFTRCGLAERPF
jgi:hypothetical protein